MSFEIGEPVAVRSQGYDWPARIVHESTCLSTVVLDSKKSGDIYLIQYFGDSTYEWHSQNSAKRKMKSGYNYSFQREVEDQDLVGGMGNALREYREYMDQHPELQAKKRQREKSSKKVLPSSKRRKLNNHDDDSFVMTESMEPTIQPKKKKKKKKKLKPKKKKKVVKKKKKLRKKKRKKSNEEVESDLELDEDEGIAGSSSDSDLELDENKNKRMDSSDYLKKRMEEYYSSEDDDDDEEDDEKAAPQSVPLPPPINYKMSDEEIIASKNQIEKFVNENQTKEILRWISDISMKTQTVKQFKVYKFPKHLNSLRKKAKDKECPKQFKELILKWKKLLQQLFQIEKFEVEKRKREAMNRARSNGAEKKGDLLVESIEKAFSSTEGAKYRNENQTRDFGTKLIASGLYKGGGVGFNQNIFMRPVASSETPWIIFFIQNFLVSFFLTN